MIGRNVALAAEDRKRRKIRTAEANHVLGMLRSIGALDSTKKKTALEIGSGTGIQAGILRIETDLVATDIYRSPSLGRDIRFVLCSATNLPFRAGSFNLVFSSEVLEHIGDREAAMHEMRRVLQGDGYLISVVPTPFWKISHMMTLPFRLFLQAVETDAKGVTQWGIKKPSVGSITIHGEYKSAREEYGQYMRNRWLSLHVACGFQILLVEAQISYSALEVSLPLETHLRRLGSGFASTLAIVARPAQ